MSHTYHGPPSLLSPLPLSSPLLESTSFGPLSHYHPPIPTTENKSGEQSGLHSESQNQYSAHPEEIVSPLGTKWPDSPTLGYLSPVSILSPHLSLPPEPSRLNRTQGEGAEAHSTSSVAVAEPGFHQPEAPQTFHLARGGTVHMQDLVPFKPAATRFPPRKPLATQRVGPTEAAAGPARPITLYLADHNPHLVAPAPTAPIARPRYMNGVSYVEGPAEEGELELQEVELKEYPARSQSQGCHGEFHARSPHVRNEDAKVGGEEGERTKEEVKARNQNWVIGGVLILALVVAIVLVAVLVSLADR